MHWQPKVKQAKELLRIRRIYSLMGSLMDSGTRPEGFHSRIHLWSLSVRKAVRRDSSQFLQLMPCVSGLRCLSVGARYWSGLWSVALLVGVGSCCPRAP